MKNIKKYILLLGLLLGSFYLTNESILAIRNEDMIMKQIDKNSEKYQIDSIDAEVFEKTIIPGVKGQTVDREKSYHKMRQYGNYSETMTVVKEVTPKVSINTYYDKYIEQGNNTKRRVALVFPIENKKSLESILPIIKKQEVVGTFFLDGNQIDQSSSYLKKYREFEYEVLSFQGNTNPYYLKTSESYLESITKKEMSFCYTEKENQELLDYCSKNKHHTIKPKFILTEDLTYQVKKNIENGLIISIILNNNNIKEISPMIQYIKQKGYQFETLNELLKE